jgi:23S rRNA-intervening sequence protein
MKDFKELNVWIKAHAVALRVYAETRRFPKDELYGLTSQMRRAASSVAANIAEGCGRRSDGELNRFCTSREAQLNWNTTFCLRTIWDILRIRFFSRLVGRSTRLSGC